MFIPIYHHDNKSTLAHQVNFELNVELFELLVDDTSDVSGGNEKDPYIIYLFYYNK